MSRARSFLREVHRRNVWRNAGIFVGGGWGVLQVFDLFIERGFVPEWVFGGALVTLALGLPVVVLTSWVQGGGSEWAEDDGPDVLDVFTWRRTAVGGVLAFAFLGVLTAGYMLMRVTGIGLPGTLTAQGVFEEGGTIVLADFESTAGDAAPSELLTETLRVDLSLSTAFSLLSPAAVAETLGLMRREAAEGLPEDVAREVAVRNGAEAVVSGEVGRLGSGFVLNARVLAAESGDVLAPFRVTAASEAELIEAIDELSRDMRSKIGESLRSVAASESLPDVTTSSLEALRRYSTARSRLDRGLIDSQTAQRLYMEAIQLDTTFASAYRGLAIAITNYGGDRETHAWAATAAFRHRERLTESERLASEAYYYSTILGDYPRAMQAYLSMMERFPGRGAPAVNVADQEMYAGNYEEAVRVLRIQPWWDSPAWIFNYMAALSGGGNLDAALAVRDTAEIRLAALPYNTPIRALLLTVWDRPAEAREVLAAGPEPRGSARATQWITESLVDVAQGRLEDAVADVGRSVEAWGALGLPGLQLEDGLKAPLATAVVGRDRAAASAQIERLLADLEWESMSPVDRAYPFVALLRAFAGDVAGAREAVSRYEAGVSEYPLPTEEAIAGIATALAALTERGAGALPAFESAVRRYRCARCRDFLLGYAYETVGRGPDAIEPYERYLAHRFFDGSDPFTFYFSAYTHERLGLLHDEAGDVERAREHYAVFAELWADADEALQPRVRHARERLAALGGGAP